MQTQKEPTKRKKRTVKKTTKKTEPKSKKTVQKKPKSHKKIYEQIKGIKYLWQLKTFDFDTIREIGKNHNLCLPIAQTLFSRGLTEKNEIRDYLFTSFEKDVPKGTLLKGSKAAVKRIIKAIDNKEKILIFGDYDVDGVTSTALILLTLIPLGARINYYLPNRKREGYGLSKAIVQKALEHDYKLIITVDNGITAHPAADDAHKAGIDLIITDHHRPHGTLPKAVSIVNPNQPRCRYPYKELAGVGVSFKLISMIYQEKGLTLPEKVYELLTLGTIADVAPLTGENRFWVKHGLGKINRQRSYSLSVLADNSQLRKAQLGSLDIGFMITPQINALGRLDDSRDAVKFLVSDDFSEVRTIGVTLKNMNEERKRIERGIHNEIEEAILNKHIDLDKENVIMAAHKKWPTGVIGLVAGKLMHNHGKPALLFHIDDNGIAKGSCRSIPAFNIFNALKQCDDLLIKFGGHSFAAGLSLKQDDLPKLKERMEEIVAKTVAPEDLQPTITLDAHLDLNDANNKLFKDMTQLEPFGNQNPQPTFLIKHVTLLKPPTLLKDKHVKCLLFSDGMIKSTIFFNRPDIYQLLLNIGDQPFNVVGHVIKNEWNDNVSIEVQGIDIAV